MNSRDSPDNAGDKIEVTEELDAELSDYWNCKNNESSRRNEAIQAGRKRSVKDCLGSRMNSRDSTGVPREIPELNQAELHSPPACFQSQFARDVVQNTRQSSSNVVLQQQQQQNSVNLTLTQDQISNSNLKSSIHENSVTYKVVDETKRLF